ncbi:PepSY domain-containing protein [bacterium]|nr:PepSY domain-containing protein [bacterium]
MRDHKIWILLFCALFTASLTQALQPKDKGGLKEFFKPELVITSSHVPVEDTLLNLTNSAEWTGFFTKHGREVRGFIDPRSGAATNILGAIPLIPGKGHGNKTSLQDVSSRIGYPVSSINKKVMRDLIRTWIHENHGVLDIDVQQLGDIRAEEIHADLWQISIQQLSNGVKVRDGRIGATVSHGNLILIGTESWGNARTSTHPRISADQALQKGFQYAGGRMAQDELLKQPELELIPYAPEVKGGAKGYKHYLAWVYTFRRLPEQAVWEVLVDAHSGELLAFQDKNQYVSQQITGGVYPLTSTEICPTNDTCGTMQSGWPMPWANTGLASPNNFTNSAGLFNYTSGTVTTTLAGQYVRIVDSCGAITASASGSINLGGTNGQHDCTSAGFSAGNTAASRSGFYEVNKLAELARGWLPGNTWLQNQLTANMNLNNTCNAFYSTLNGTINFYRSGGGCRNTGEMAGVFDHEWGHGLDDNDTNGSLSNSSEAYADIAANYRLQASCVGHGFFWTSNKGCGNTADGTGFNQNEAQTGASHCDLDCSGVRDADWDKHANHTPDTPQNFVCGSCLSSSGPCGRQVHCAAAPSRQAAWDLAARDLTSAPFNYDTQTAFAVASKIFYQGSGNIGLWHACDCTAGTSNGCGSTNAYMQWLAADDNDGNINNGTPHMTAIFNAFNRHNIACATPSPVNSGCSGGPTAGPTVNATPGNNQVALSWNSISGATRYWVFRTEGHAGCDFGKTLIAEVTTLNYTDTQVANGRTYYYSVAGAGTSSACYGVLSACVSATPTSGGCTLPGTPSLVSPADGATNQSTTPLLDWSDASDASTHEVQVATDSGFTNVVRSATGLATSQWTVSPALSNSTTYFWRARGVNACGNGTYSTSRSFTTVAAPVGDFTLSCSPTSLTGPRGSSRTSTCTIQAISGFNSPVTLSCSGLPAKTSCSFSPNPANPNGGSINSTLTLTIQKGAPVGTFNFQVNGTGGSQSHSQAMQVTITRR